MIIVLSVLLFTASDYPFVIFWSLYCLSFYLRLPITPLLSFGHCIVCPSIYGFRLPLCYLVVIVLSVLLFTASDYPFGILVIVLSVLLFTACDYPFVIFWSLYCLSFYLRLPITPLVFCSLYCLSFYLRLPITPLLSFGHCIVCPSIYGLRLPLCYLLVIVLSVLLFTAITPLLSFGHCIICPSIYDLRLPLCYILIIVLSVLLFTASDYPFVILWSLYCLSFYLRPPITSLLYFDHCIVCPSIYGFRLPLCHPLVIVLSVLLFTASDYPFVIFWSLYCLSFYLRLPITSLLYFDLVVIVLSVLLFTASDYPFVIFGHCIVCPSIYGFRLPLCYLLVIVLSVLLFTASDYPFGILFIVLSVLLFTASDYPFVIFWPLYCLSFYLRLPITPLLSCGHCIVCPSIYDLRLPLCYILIIVLSVLLFTASDYPFVILWSLYCLSFYLRLPITPLLSFGHCIVCPSIYGFRLLLCYLVVIVLSVLLFTASDYPFGILVIVLSVLLFTVSDYPFVIFWSLYCLSFYLRLPITPLVFCSLYCLSFYLRLPITPLLSFGHCIVCPSIYGFRLPLCYLVVIVLSVLLFTASDYPFVFFWSLYCLSFYLRLPITPLLSCGHCIVCPSIDGFRLPLWYFVHCIVCPSIYGDYPFVIVWSLYYLSFYLRPPITSLLYFDHCIVCPSIYGFRLPLCYLAVILLSVLLFTASDYPFVILWSLYCLSFYLQLPITPLLSCGHCIVCPSIYGFRLPLCYLAVIVLSVLLFTASDYPFVILWSLYCLSFYLRLNYPFGILVIVLSPLALPLGSLYCLSFYLRIPITPLLSFGHCIVCPSIYGFRLPLWYFGHCIVCPSIYGFRLPLCYLLVIVLSVLLFTLPITTLFS